jgi:hypothetical protein
MNIFQDFPSQQRLISKFGSPYITNPLDVNTHFHTPYSFSAFESIHEIFERAEKEQVDILGINDFITTFGYVEFNDLAQRYKKFPVFSIEFMGLMKDEQAKGIRINDPNNPGRIYFCGKGLAFPEQFSEYSRDLLQQVFDESHKQTMAMTRKLNEHLQKIDAPFQLEFNEIREKFSKGMVRERHLAKALRKNIEEHFGETQNINKFLEKLCGGRKLEYAEGRPAKLDNELRSILLKKGGVAFIEEDQKAFLTLPQIQKIILDARGIPCYPVLLDDTEGNYTDFEADPERLFIELAKRKIYAIELIPGRNDINHLKRFVEFFNEKGFIITMGTEHNTPEMIPMKLRTRNNEPLDHGLKATVYYGACIIAAHQFLTAKGQEGYLTKEGFPRIEKQDEFITLGNAVIRTFTNKQD